MATALGTLNPNSKQSQSLRGENSPLALVPALPLPRDNRIRVLESTIRQVERMRAWNYKLGDVYGARLQAIRLGCLRSELRRMKGGM
jgi:hypothetical protein